MFNTKTLFSLNVRLLYPFLHPFGPLAGSPRSPPRGGGVGPWTSGQVQRYSKNLASKGDTPFKLGPGEDFPRLYQRFSGCVVGAKISRRFAGLPHLRPSLGTRGHALPRATRSQHTRTSTRARARTLTQTRVHTHTGCKRTARRDGAARARLRRMLHLPRVRGRGEGTPGTGGGREVHGRGLSRPRACFCRPSWSSCRACGANQLGVRSERRCDAAHL